MNRYGHYMTVLDSSFCTVETRTWLWKFLSSSLPQCLCQEHEETCSQKSLHRNHSLTHCSLVSDKITPYNGVKAKWNSDFRFGGKSAAASNKASHAASKSLLFSFVLDTFQAISVIFLTVQAQEDEYQTSGFVGEENL